MTPIFPASRPQEISFGEGEAAIPADGDGNEIGVLPMSAGRLQIADADDQGLEKLEQVFPNTKRF